MKFLNKLAVIGFIFIVLCGATSYGPDFGKMLRNLKTSIIPYTNNTYDLGSLTKMIRSVYVYSSLYMTSSSYRQYVSDYGFTWSNNGYFNGTVTATGGFVAGSSQSVKHSASSGIETIESINGTNNNKLKIDLESVLKLISIYAPDTGIKFCKDPDDVFLAVQHFDGSSTYTNNTVEASKTEGSAFTIMADTDDRLYVTWATKPDSIK